MDRKILFSILVFSVLAFFLFCGCGGEKDMKTAPGTLVGIHYNRTNGSVANDEFHIYVTPENFTTEYWPENPDEWVYDEVTYSYVMTEKKGEITEEQWKEIEETFLAVYPDIIIDIRKETFFDKLRKIFISEAMILDGGDYTFVTAKWQTEQGIITEKLKNPQGINGYRFYLLLKELVDPTGIEIPKLEKNQQS